MSDRPAPQDAAAILAGLLKYLDHKIAYWTGYAEACEQHDAPDDVTLALSELHDIREYVNHGSIPNRRRSLPVQD